MEPYETFEHSGLTVEIYHDDDPMNPREDYSCELGTILYGKRSSYVLGDETAEAEEIERISESKEYFSLPVYAYIHSCVILNTVGFHCPWDSGQSGIIYVEKSKARKWFGKKLISKKLEEKIYSQLKSEVDLFSMYLNGDCYGFKIKDSEGEEIESTWGYFGLNEARNEAKAEAESTTAYIKKKALEEELQEKQADIFHNIAFAL